MEIPSFISQKTQEICFAVIRISFSIRRPKLAGVMEKLSYRLMENLTYGKTEVTLLTISALRNFVLLGKNIYEIEPVNAKLIDRELEELEIEIGRVAGAHHLPDLQSIFTHKVEVKKDSKEKSKSDREISVGFEDLSDELIIDDFEIARSSELSYGNEDNAELPYGNRNVAQFPYGNDEDDSDVDIGDDDKNAEIRKQKIFVMINSAPERRLSSKEVTSAFPEVSGRTIRSDLKKLAEEGRLLRQGSGGPSNYYQVANFAAIDQDSVEGGSVVTVDNFLRAPEEDIQV